MSLPGMELTVPLNKDPVDDLDPDDVDVMGMKKKYGAPAIGSNFGRKNWNAAEVRRKQARGGVDVCWPGAVRHMGKRAGGARKRGVTTRIVGSLANRCPAIFRLLYPSLLPSLLPADRSATAARTHSNSQRSPSLTPGLYLALPHTPPHSYPPYSRTTSR